jgi:hypothetical protein
LSFLKKKGSFWKGFLSSWNGPFYLFKKLLDSNLSKKLPTRIFKWAFQDAYLSFPQEESNALIRRWNQVVTGRLAQSDTFRLMPNMELTNDSIVSFMVLVDGRALNNAELKKLFDFLVLNEHEGLDGFNRIFLGYFKIRSNNIFLLALSSF